MCGVWAQNLAQIDLAMAAPRSQRHTAGGVEFVRPEDIIHHSLAADAG